MTKISWDKYIQLLFIIGVNVALVAAWIVLAVLVTPYMLFLCIFNIVTVIPLAAEDKEYMIPDKWHMNRKCEYMMEPLFSNGNDVYVKVWPGFWIETKYRVETLEEFIEKKIDYQHKMKETFTI